MKVSVVVPARNEEKALPELLDSLLVQSLPPDEIIVADGGSTDRTVELASSYAGRGVKVLILGPAYPGRGRNAGVGAARNEWLAFIDAGCEADPRWLEALADLADKGGSRPRAVFGAYRARLRDEWERAQALGVVPPVDPASGCPPPVIVSSLLHRSAWEAAGPFREDLRAAEDLLFFERLKAAGVPMARAPRAVVTWQLPSGPWAAFRRFRLYSRHHLAAGLYKTWHLRVMAMDVTAAVLLVAAPSVPAARWVLAGAVAGRLLRTVAVRQGNIAPAAAFRPDRVARVAVILLLADIAAWAGAVDYLLGHGDRK